MRDSIDDGVDADQAFSDDFCRLLREGLVHLTYDDPDAPPRVYVTARGRAELQAPTPEAIYPEAIYPIYSGGPWRRPADDDHECLDWNSGGACFLCRRPLSIEEQTRGEPPFDERPRPISARSDQP